MRDGLLPAGLPRVSQRHLSWSAGLLLQTRCIPVRVYLRSNIRDGPTRSVPMSTRLRSSAQPMAMGASSVVSNPSRGSWQEVAHLSCTIAPLSWGCALFTIADPHAHKDQRRY